MKIQHINGDKLGGDALADALTSPDLVTRIMARGAASNWIEEFSTWFNVEMRQVKPGDMHQLIYAIAKLQMQTFAGIAAQISDQAGDKVLLNLYLDLARAEIPEHMRRTREWRRAHP